MAGIATVARKCSRIARRSGRKGSYQACMKRLLKRKGRRRKKK